MLVVAIVLCSTISVMMLFRKPDAYMPPENIGRAVYVQNRQLFVHGEPFTVKGVCYSPTPVGQNVETGYNWWEDPETYTNDFPMIKEMGANTVYTFESKDATREALDAAHSNGIFVIMGYWVDWYADLSSPSVRQTMMNKFTSIVRKWKNHPAVLMWAFGSEVNMFYQGDKKDWYTLLQEAAHAAHEEEGENYHPVVGFEADGTSIGDPGLKSDDASLTDLDVWGIDTFTGRSFGNLFLEHRSRTDKPLILGQWGCDAYDEAQGVEDQSTQAEYVGNLWDEIENNLDGNSGVCLGATVFEWSDEWWKSWHPDAGDILVHDTLPDWTNYAYPDPNMNEEWWGITSISPETYEKTPRQVYFVLKERWG